MIVGGVAFAAWQGADFGRVLTQATLAATEDAVTFAFSLIGLLAFWSGLMKVAEEAGITRALARLLSPVVRRLFPSVPEDHPANASILIALSANLLGLGNAVTPLGIKAMEDLADLDGRSGRASDAMCTFLAICTSSLTIIPGTVIAMRAAAGSTDPTAIVGTTIIATSVSTCVAVALDRLARRRSARP